MSPGAPSAPAGDAGSPAMGASRHRWLVPALLGAGLALLAAIVLAALTFDRSTVDAVARVGLGRVLVLAGLMTGGWLAAATRVHLLTRTLGHRLRFRDSFTVAVSGEFGVAASPTGLGGTALRLAALRSRGVPLPEGTAVVGADLVLDGGVAVLVTSVALPLALVLPGTRHMAGELAAELDPRLPWIAGALLLLVVTAGLAWRGWRSRRRRRREAGASGVGAGGRRREAAEAVEPTPADGEPPAPEADAGGRGGWGRWRRWRRRGAEALFRIRTGVGTLFRYHPRTVALAFLLALVQILLRYSILPVVVMALGGRTPVFLLYPLQGLLNMLAHLVVLPGGGGSVELAAGVVLPLFVPTALVGVAVLLWRLFTFHWNLFIGGTVFFLSLPGARRRQGG